MTDQREPDYPGMALDVLRLVNDRLVESGAAGLAGELDTAAVKMQDAAVLASIAQTHGLLAIAHELRQLRQLREEGGAR